MNKTLLSVGKRIGRTLIIIVLGLVLILIGFILRGFVPTTLLQSVQIGSITLPDWVVQFTPVDLSTSSPDGMEGINDACIASVTPVPSETPARSNRSESGIVTAITLTPTSIVPSANMAPTNTPTFSLDPQQATSTPGVGNLPAIPTPMPSITPQQANAPSSETAGLSQGTDLSFAMVKVRLDLQSLSRIIEATRIMVESISQGTPIDEKRIAVRVLLNVVDQRLARLGLQLQAAITASAPIDSTTSVSLGQVYDLILLSDEALKFLENDLSSPDNDNANLVRALTYLEHLQVMVEQMQSLVATMSAESQRFNPIITPTTIETLSPTATAVPTINLSTDQGLIGLYNQLYAMLEEMEKLLRQLQNRLQEVPR